MKTEYLDFLKSKMEIAPESGFDYDVGLIDFLDGTQLKPHQRDAINWALEGGRRALFESFGLGKTIQQIIILNAIIKREGGKALIICPLAVQHEFKKDAMRKLGIKIEYVKTLDEAIHCECDIMITNYERVRDGDLVPDIFTAVSLDEASVLRGYGTKTYQTFLPKFKKVKYRFVATATPSPNKYKELIHYAGFLGIMDTGQALTRFFKRDSTKANNLTLYPAREKEFWLWISSWALFITKPSDLGYDDDEYVLPPLNIIEHKLSVDHSTAGVERDGQVKMFRDAALSLQDTAQEKRDSIKMRVQKTKEIVYDFPDKHFILWHHREEERHQLKKAIPEMSEIYGTLDLGTREQRTLDFADGKTRIVGSKPKISGSGTNWQWHCSDMIFVGIDYKFNDWIQSLHRVYRFGQTEQVNIHIIYTESEQAILAALYKKWEQHNSMVEKMVEIIKKYGLSNTNIQEKLMRTIGVDRMVTTGKTFELYYNDNVLEIKNFADNSIQLIHTSIPFGNHYEYSPSYNDFGHNENTERFFDQMDYLTPELLRILEPGRVAAIHVKDRVLFGNATGNGMPSMDYFHADCIKHYVKHGFIYFGMITIITDVVRENNQTYRLGWSEQCKDGSKMGVGCPEYVLLFRKLPTDTTRAYADNPIVKTKQEYTRGRWQIDAHGFWRSNGNRLMTAEDLKDIPVDSLQKIYTKWSKENIYNYEDHVSLSDHLDELGKLPATFMVVAPGSWQFDVWDDINRMLTLNSSQSSREQELHICPLQFDIVDRIINRYSNPGDKILDPFAGIGTVPYRAIKAGRYGIGIELNQISYNDSIWYCKRMEEDVASPTLFDLVDEEMAL